MPLSPQVTGWLGTLAIVLAVSAAVTQVLDFALSESAKSRLSLGLTHFWYWLERQRVGRLLDFLQNSRVISWVLVIISGLALVVVIWSIAANFGQPVLVPEAVIWVYGVQPGFAIALVALTLSPFFGLAGLIRWITAKGRPLSTFLRVATVFLVAAVPVLLVASVIYLFSDSWDPRPFVVGVSVLAALTMPMALAAVLACLMATWLALLAALKVLLSILEFLVRRIIEYPKGPVLAANVLLGAAGVILKAIS